MNRNNRNAHEGEIRIYRSLWKTTLLSLLCLAFAAIGGLMIMDNDGSAGRRLLAGWLNVIFFGGCGLSVLAVNVHNRIRHIPFLIIHRDRLECYVQFKGTYYTIDLADVERFRMIRIFGAGQIAVDYKPAPLAGKYEKASSPGRRLLEFNLNVSGAVESIPADGLTMPGKKICAILNGRLAGIA